jgi:tetratricopeptide (TPR) repeat protein
MTLALPILIVLYEICFKKLNFKNFLKRIPVYLPYLLMILTYVFVRFYWLKIGDRSNLGPTYLVVSNQAKLGIFEILIRYIKLLLFPLNLTVHYNVPDYIFAIFYNTVTRISPSGYLLQKIGDYAMVIPVIAVSFLAGLTLKIFKNSLVRFSILWFLFSLLPVLNILPQGSAVAERFLYTPSFGFCLLLALGIHKLAGLKIIKIPAKTRLIAAGLIFTVIISLYSVRTIIRNLDWKTQESIFIASVKLDPKGYLPNATLGSVKFEEDQLDESIFYTKRAIEASPNDVPSHYQLGLAYEKKGEYDNAFSAYQQCLKLQSDYMLANFGLANVYKKQGLLDKSITEYEKILDRDKNNVTALFNLAGVYTEKKMYPEALKVYQEVAKINPTGVVYSNIAYIYEVQNKLDDAAAEYRKAVEAEPDNFHFHSNLGSVLFKKGDKKGALEEYKKALLLEPENKFLQNTIKELEPY